MPRGSFTATAVPVVTGVSRAVSRAALQQAMVIVCGLSHGHAGKLCGVSKKTIWLSVASSMGGRTPWEKRTEQERTQAVVEARRLIDEEVDSAAR